MSKSAFKGGAVISNLDFERFGTFESDLVVLNLDISLKLAAGSN